MKHNAMSKVARLGDHGGAPGSLCRGSGILVGSRVAAAREVERGGREVAICIEI
jgi:hypothetical protein